MCGRSGIRCVSSTRQHAEANNPRFMQRVIVGLATFLLVSGAGYEALPPAAIAHADETSYRFLSPSGNIGCDMEDDAGGRSFAVCKIRDHTWVAPPSEYCQQAAVPGATGGPGSDMQLRQGNPPCVGFSMDQLFWPPDPLANYPILGSGQTHSLGTITCDSEPSSVTCTDTSTGHFFRVSRESYQLS